MSLLKPDRPRGQNTVSEQHRGYPLVFVLGDPWIARSQWVDVCLLCRDGQLSGCLGLLALPYMDLFSRSEWVRCKSIKALASVMWKPDLTIGGGGGGEAEMLPELFLQESAGGGSHRIERKASCSKSSWSAIPLGSRPPEAGRPLTRLTARGKGCKGLQRGANNALHQYVTDLLKSAPSPS